MTDGSAGTFAAFYSREDSVNAPTLVVNYGAAPAPTPTPTPTPTPNAHAYPDPHANPDSHADPNSDAHPDPDSDTHPDTNTHPDAHTDPDPHANTRTPCTVSSLLVPSCGVWWGIGATPLGSESYSQALTNFEATQGRASDILHFYHSAQALFPSAATSRSPKQRARTSS